MVHMCSICVNQSICDSSKKISNLKAGFCDQSQTTTETETKLEN